MGRLWFFIAESARALRRNAAPSMAAIVTTVVTVVLLGILIPVFQVAQAKSQSIRDELSFRVAIYDDATQSEIGNLRQQLLAIPHVSTVQFVTKGEALKELGQSLNEKDQSLLKQLNSNPLPANFIVKADDASHLDSIRSAVAPGGTSSAPGVPPSSAGAAASGQYVSPIIQDVFDRNQDRNKIEQVTSSLKIVLTILTALLVAASVMLVGNTIRLSIYTRRREVEVMRLVGATRWFIRWPFMIEGMVVGFVGGVVAILILWLGKVTIVDRFSDSTLFSSLNTMSFPLLIAILFSAAILVTAVGSGITLRRFLRV
jgi:cell division transport system permease protein